MSDVLGESTEPTPFGEASVVDLLQQDFEELAKIKDVYIPIPGYEKSGLAAKYVLPESGKVLDTIARKVMREDKDQYARNLHISIDTCIYLNEGLYVKPIGVEEYVELDPENTGFPINLKDTVRMATVFKWNPDEYKTARQCFKHLFREQDIPLLNHAEKLQRWINNTKTDITLEVWQMGES